MKTTIINFTIIAAIVLLIWGGYRVDRWINYKLGYEDYVKKDMAPIENRLSTIEERLDKLEKDK